MAFFRFRNLAFRLHPLVYEPAEDSVLLAENLAVNHEDTVLDLGTGVGLQAAVAAHKAKRVLASDINPQALAVAQENARINNLKNISFILSDLFENIHGRFDLVVFNPPYLPCRENDVLGRAWAGGKEGVEVINRFMDSVQERLKPEGRFQIILSSLNNPDEVGKKCLQKNIILKTTAEKKLPFETIYAVTGELIPSRRR